MRWSLQLLPYQLWPNTTRGSKIFVTKAEYRIICLWMVVTGMGRMLSIAAPVVPGRTFQISATGSFASFPLSRRGRFSPKSEHSMPAFMSTRPSVMGPVMSSLPE
jgi:hypothetical protein